MFHDLGRPNGPGRGLQQVQVSTTGAGGLETGAQHLVGTAPGFACLREVEHVLLAIHQEMMTRDAELCTLVVVVPMPCSHIMQSQIGFLHICEIVLIRRYIRSTLEQQKQVYLYLYCNCVYIVIVFILYLCIQSAIPGIHVGTCTCLGSVM